MWILGEFFCGMGGLECENGTFFLSVFACSLWRMCVVFSYLCDSGCRFLEFRFFLNLFESFSLLKKKAWGLDRLN